MYFLWNAFTVRQWWQEFLAQYDYHITYIPGEANCMADALSRLSNSMDDEGSTPITLLLTIGSDPSLLQTIKDGYNTDPLWGKMARVNKSLDGIWWTNRLLYVGDQLVIPCVGSLCKDLFRLVHDLLGHFGFTKSYATLRDDYYWPNKHRDLSKAYIPACVECQHDKNRTSRPVASTSSVNTWCLWGLNCNQLCGPLSTRQCVWLHSYGYWLFRFWYLYHANAHKHFCWAFCCSIFQSMVLWKWTPIEHC